MDNKRDKLTINMEYDDGQTVPLALHEMHMARSDRRLYRLCICWAISLVAFVLAFAWLWNQYTNKSRTELTGVYCLVDSQGNVVTSDLAPDDVIRILEELNDGKGEEN